MLIITTGYEKSVTIDATEFEVDADTGHLWVKGEGEKTLAVFPAGAWKGAVVVEEAAK